MRNFDRDWKLKKTSQKNVERSKNTVLRGWTAEARKTTILQPGEQKPHSQKDRQDEKAEGDVPDEATR